MRVEPQGAAASGRVAHARAEGSKTVSLVLGGGGARGLAHIGVIQWLLENGYEIASISGTSIGALVGGIYASQKLDDYAQWVLALERKHVLRLLDPTIGKPGLFKGERIISVLRELIGDYAIEDLSISYTAVATDLASLEEVWLREGKLFDAIRASIATPLVFTPFKHGGRTLLDGALVNPVPIGPTLQDPTDLKVVVDLSGPAQEHPVPHFSTTTAPDNSYRRRIGKFINARQPARVAAEPRHGMLDVALASMQVMQDTITQLRLAAYSPDVTIAIPRNACSFFEFWRAEELIVMGRESAAQAFARHVALATTLPSTFQVPWNPDDLNGGFVACLGPETAELRHLKLNRRLTRFAECGEWYRGPSGKRQFVAQTCMASRQSSLCEEHFRCQKRRYKDRISWSTPFSVCRTGR